MNILLSNIRHGAGETEIITEAIPSTGYLMFQYVYLILILILVIMAILSVFRIFKPSPKVFENNQQDFLSKEHFKKKPAPIDWQEKEENIDFKKYM